MKKQTRNIIKWNLEAEGVRRSPRGQVVFA
jgi:hypothetical protein